MRRRVAFVVQRAGQEVNGGAEALCLQVAQRMAEHWQAEVLTTCALDYMRWENYYAVGEESIDRVVVRRFRVDAPRDVPHFDQLSRQLVARGADATLEQQEQWMRAQGPISSALFTYLREHSDNFDAFIFFGYLYATTYFGLPLVREKAWLAPLGHDEWTVHLPMWDEFFALPRGLIFQTPEERDFLRHRFPQLALHGPIAGIGIEKPPAVQPETFRAKYRLTQPFLLYVGRVDEAKGCRELFEYFIRWRSEEGPHGKLVLTGRESMAVPFHKDIIYLGFVEEAEKWNAMAACDWLVMPSPHESLSIVLLETWSVGRPALVNSQSQVLVGHCQRAHAGLWYNNFEQWRACLTRVDEPAKRQMGRQGEAYVRSNYSWERVVNDYLQALRH